MRLLILSRLLCLCLVCSGVLMGCDSLDNTLKTDRTGGYSKQDYRDALASRDEPASPAFGGQSKAAGSIPKLKPYISQSYTQRRQFPLVSVSVNNSVPLKDVFYQLARQADYDLELDPAIRGTMIFTARQRPLDQVVDRICNLAGLRYTLDDKVLRVELDTPYNHTYKLDYLSFVRSNSSSIDTSVSVVSGEGADTGSSFSSSFESSSDFWADLEANLESLLSNSSSHSLANLEEPELQAVETGSDDDGGSIFNIGAIESDEDDDDDAQEDEESEDADGSSGGGRFIINRQAGLVSVYANQSMHREISAFLHDLKKALTAQVLIEAKVLEVSLNDQFAVGVDWNLLDSGLPELDLNYVSSSGLGSSSTINRIPNNAESVTAMFSRFTGNDLDVLLRAVSQFGTTKALASPRLVVLNNQSSVLNVATNRVFFILNDVEEEEDEDTGNITTNYDYETRTIPEGVIINVMPSINLEKQTVSLVVRPSVTSLDGEGVTNPFVSEGGATVPEVSIQEIDTVLNVRSGEAVIIGGLMQDRTSSSQEGVPILGEVPLIGSLFRHHNDTVSKTELVIFLKATILDQPDDSIHDTDRDLYRKFSADRRPFRL